MKFFRLFSTFLLIMIFSVFFAGCVLFQELFGISPSESLSSSTQNATKVTRPSTSQSSITQGTRIRAQAYKTPESYAEAYAYRTDAAEQKIRTLIRDRSVESLRLTNPVAYIKKINEEIAKISQNDFEKTKMIHDVVCLLVSYDAKSYWSGNTPSQDWKTVVSTKLAVCEGYSNLFKYMCDVASITCEKIHGYARGVGSALTDEASPNDSNHAWNIVKINNAWYMIDCTWDSGYMDGRIARQSYTTDYLFLKPEHMIYTHFPSDSRKQLLAKNLSAVEFYNLPEVKPKFFDACTMNDMPAKKQLVTNSLLLPYSLNENYELSFRITNIATKMVQKNCTLVLSDGKHSYCKFSFPQKGNYLVDVFYSKTKSRGGSGCMQFIVEAEDSSSIRFPQIFSVAAKNARLISPTEMPLKSGEPISFSVYVEDRKFVTLIYGKNFIPLENQGDGFFTGEIEIPRGVKQLSIAFSQSERGSYQSFAQFTVE
ncbi:MAG: hypothetical protein IJR49_02965 [Treponema sp.]|nr:hypothetical protein [Treponema sp.]